jgi:hypothetical protein
LSFEFSQRNWFTNASEGDFPPTFNADVKSPTRAESIFDIHADSLSISHLTYQLDSAIFTRETITEDCNVSSFSIELIITATDIQGDRGPEIGCQRGVSLPSDS